MRSTHRLAALGRSIALVAVLLGGAIASSSGAAGAAIPSLGIAGQSPSAILATSLRAASAQHAVTVTEVQRAPGKVATQTANSLPHGGEQFLEWAAGAHADIRLVHGVVYLRDDLAGIKAMFGVNEPKYANRWLQVTAAVPLFPSLAQGIAMPSLLSELAPSGTLTKSRVETVGGHRVIAITGKPNQTTVHVDGTETFYVLAAAPFLPFEVVGHLTANGKSASLVIRISNWNKPFDIAVPKSSIPITKTNL